MYFLSNQANKIIILTHQKKTKSIQLEWILSFLLALTKGGFILPKSSKKLPKSHIFK